MIFPDLSIKGKLISIIMLISFVTVSAGYTFAIINDIVIFRNNLKNNVIMNAKLTGEYCITPLAFSDQTGATEILKKLETIPYITNGYVYDTAGELFASYNRADEIISLPKSVKDFSKYAGKYIYVLHTLKFKDREYGKIYLRASAQQLYEKVYDYILTMFLFITLSMLLAYFMALKLQKILSQPILNLADMTGKISEQGDYSLRIEREGRDEITILYNEFNNMLEQINIREDALKKSEQWFRDLVETSSDWIWQIDENACFTYTSPKVTDILGYTAEEIIGKTPFMLMPPGEAERISDIFEPIAEAREPFSGIINLNEHKNGKSVFLDTSGVPVFDTDGSFHGYRGIDRDITERMKEEDERKRLNIELARKNKELEQVLYVTSHDLRAPLLNVQGFSGELLEALKDLDTIFQKVDLPATEKEKITKIMEDDISEASKYIIASITKMDALLKGLLLLSRLGRFELKIEKIDMNELVASVFHTIEFQVQEKGAEIEIADLPRCLGDQDRVNQVFSNLIENGLKYLDPKRKGFVRVTGYVENKRSVYCIEDNGIGIAPEQLNKIFEIFQRLHPEETEGEGLGLTIVRQILERLNGEVHVESTLGQGSRFYVSLPTA